MKRSQDRVSKPYAKRDLWETIGTVRAWEVGKRRPVANSGSVK